MDRRIVEIEERSNKRKETEIGEVNQQFFVYTSETNKDTDIPQKTLTHLRVDSSVEVIPVKAFKHCEALVQVQLPETLTKIEEFAFFKCSSLRCVKFGSDASLETSSMNPDLEDGLIVFPDRLMLQIDNCAFRLCKSLRKVVICSVSTRLGKGVFRSCKSLVSVELPEGLQMIEEGLFRDCESLTAVKMPSSLIKICAGAFAVCRSLSTLDLPKGLQEIGSLSFWLCGSIEILIIPATVSSIGNNAFRDCSGLKYVELPPVLRLGSEAFSGCTSLSHVRIPPGVNNFGTDVFLGCSGLISIELPEGVFFGVFNLAGLRSLVNVTVPQQTPEMMMSPDFLQNSKLGSAVDGYDDLTRRLKHRFDSSPLNKLCYYQSYHSSEDAMVQLRILMEENPLAASSQVDEFGMTPLHVLSLSQTVNLDMLSAVMKAGPSDHIIHGRDSFGSAPMDYLCLNRTPNSTQVIRRVLETRFDHLLGVDRQWKSDVLQAVNEALDVDWSCRRRQVVAVYFQLAKYERQEVLSSLELYLWKVKMDGSEKEPIANRQSYRINSGASVVLPHVLPFLDSIDVEDYSFSPT